MLEYAINFKNPIAIRYPRGGEDEYNFAKCEKIQLGKAEILLEGEDITIIAIGKTVAKAMKIAIKLKKMNIMADVINARFLKPLDVETIKNSIIKTKNVITIEDGTIINGLSTTIKELIIDENLEDIKIQSFAYPDEFIKHGTPEQLEQIYKLDENSIMEKITKNSCKKITNIV